MGYSIDFYKCRLSYEKTMPIVFEVSLVVFYTNMVYVLIGCGPTELIKTMGAGITFTVLNRNGNIDLLPKPNLLLSK